MNRSIVLIFCLIALMPILSQNITQQGVAYRYNGKQQRTPLGNVTIQYDANRRTALSGEDNGTFTLVLEGRKMGDRIGLVTVKKREMMVFNQHAVDEWSIRKEPLMLILCNADEFEKQKENLINIGRREAKKKYDRQKAELEAKLSASQIKQQEFEAALDKAYDELDRFQKNVGEYADLFARIDESEVDTLAQRALDLFNQGKVEEAIRLFERGNYMEKLDKALKTSQEADKLKVVAEQAKERAAQDSLKAQESLKAQIEAYKMNNEWDKAGELLKGLADRLNTVDDYWAYAYFCSKQNKFEDAEEYYNRIITLWGEDNNDINHLKKKASLQNNLALSYFNTQHFNESEELYKKALDIYRQLKIRTNQADEPNCAQTLNNLAILYAKTMRFTESERIYNEALELRRRLAQSNPQLYEPDFAQTLNNLAALYYTTRRFTESERMFKKALEINRRLAQQNAQFEPDMAMTLFNIAMIYYINQHFTESEVMYKEALVIFRRYAKTNPHVYEIKLAQVLNSLASLYDDTRQFSESEAKYKEALEIMRRMTLANPQAYEPDVAMTLNSLAYLYSHTQRFTDSEVMYQEALEIRRRLAKDNPQAYEPYVAITLNNLADLYKSTQRFTDSEKMYQEALEIRRRLAKNNPQTYEPYVAMTLSDLADLYKNTQRFTDSEVMYQKALEIRRRLAKDNPQAYEPYVAITLNNLADLYKNTQRFTDSEKMYQEALEIRRRLAKNNPQAYEPYVAMTMNNLAGLYYYTQRFTDSETMHQEALEIYRRLAKGNPQVFEPDIAQTSYNLGVLKIDTEQYAEAIPYLQEALEIYRRISKVNSAQQEWYERSLSWLSGLYSVVKNHSSAYQINQEWLPHLKMKYEVDKDALRSEYAGKLGNQSYYAILMKKYAESEQYAHEGLSIDPTKHFIYSNLAAALLFQGKYAEAEAIYHQYKDELKDGFLDDFRQFAEAGVIPKEREEDVEKIKNLLNE